MGDKMKARTYYYWRYKILCIFFNYVKYYHLFNVSITPYNLNISGHLKSQYKR